jgi:tRNA A58 N-methylase Trm61
MLIFQILIVMIFIVIIWLIYPLYTGAVFLPTPMKNVTRMLAMANLSPDDILYDMGSGDGRIIITAAERYGSRAVGIELDPIRAAYARWRISRKRLNDKVRVERRNFYSADIGEATVVTVYQGAEINRKLEEKFLKELKPGSRVVTYTFRFNKLKPVTMDHNLQVYLYTV